MLFHQIPGDNGTCLHDHIEDLSDPGAVRESAYRRGYQQALEVVLTALEDGHTLADLNGYSREVADWRHRLGKYDRPRDAIVPPPLPKRRAKR